MYSYNPYYSKYLAHYGTPRHSGRYPYGSGKRPYQHESSSKSFSTAKRKVISKLSNTPLPFKKDKLDLDVISDRGKIDEDDAKVCAILATNIFNKSSKIEPKITKDVISSINNTNAKMYGLEYRLKQPNSIAAKIGADAKEKNISLNEASKIKDSIRYTAISPENTFVKDYFKIKSSLQNKGYTEERCKNYFDLYEKGEVKHKSVQSVFSDKNGNKFEFQFHTPSSQAVKELKIPIYEERRKSGISDKRKNELENQMADLAKYIQTPNDISKIKTH